MGGREREQGVDGDGVGASWVDCVVLEKKTDITHPLSLTLVWLTVHTSTVDASVLLQNIIRTRWRLWQKKKKKKKEAVCILLLCMSRLSGFDLITSETGFNLCRSVNAILKKKGSRVEGKNFDQNQSFLSAQPDRQNKCELSTSMQKPRYVKTFSYVATLCLSYSG